MAAYIFLNNLFYVQQKEPSYTGSGQLEGE